MKYIRWFTHLPSSVRSLEDNISFWVLIPHNKVNKAGLRFFQSIGHPPMSLERFLSMASMSSRCQLLASMASMSSRCQLLESIAHLSSVSMRPWLGRFWQLPRNVAGKVLPYRPDMTFNKTHMVKISSWPSRSDKYPQFVKNQYALFFAPIAP